MWLGLETFEPQSLSFVIPMAAVVVHIVSLVINNNRKKKHTQGSRPGASRAPIYPKPISLESLPCRT